MKLSVIVPTYNMEDYLPRCLDSLLEQDIPESDYEIIIVNDESKDNSLEIAKAYQQKHANIVICDKKNGGAGAARNSGLNLAKGEFINFVDPDDYIARNVYKTLLDCATTNDVDLLTFKFSTLTKEEVFETKTDLKKLDISKIDMVNGIEYYAKGHYYGNAVWWYLINRKYLNKTGLSFIEGRWMEDAILTIQLFTNAQRVGILPLDVYRYNINPNSAMTSKEPEHYNGLISDIENAAFVYDDILKGLPDTDEVHQACKKRMKTKQQSYVFFLLVRLMKSNLPLKYIPQKLSGFKTIGAYPLDHFLGKDYNGFSYYILTKIFNKEKIIYPFMALFRLFYRPVRVFNK